jgi:hypothetical protein
VGIYIPPYSFSVATQAGFDLSNMIQTHTIQLFRNKVDSILDMSAQLSAFSYV